MMERADGIMLCARGIHRGQLAERRQVQLSRKGDDVPNLLGFAGRKDLKPLQLNGQQLRQPTDDL